MKREREREKVLTDGYKERKEKMKRGRERERPSEEGAQEREKGKSFRDDAGSLYPDWPAAQGSKGHTARPIHWDGPTRFARNHSETVRRLPIILSEFLIGPRITPHGSRPVISAAGITRNPRPTLETGERLVPIQD